MSDEKLRHELARLLAAPDAHVSFSDALGEFPEGLRGVRPRPGLHTAWQLLEHMRIAQWDILAFSRAPDHVSPDWPAGYWPPGEAPPDTSSWANSIGAFSADLKAMQSLVLDSERDLLESFPWGDGQHLLREALLVVKHNSYHLGQLVTLRRLLGIWNSD